MALLECLLLAGLLACAIAAPLCRRPALMTALYVAFFLGVAVVWVMLRSWSLAVTEAVACAGITGVLFFLTVKKVTPPRGPEDE